MVAEIVLLLASAMADPYKRVVLHMRLAWQAGRLGFALSCT